MSVGGVDLAGMLPHEAAAVCGASRATGYRWWACYRKGGWAALRDRSSRPRSHPRRLPVEAEQVIVAVRQRTHAGPVVSRRSRASGVDDGQGTAAVGLLTPAAAWRDPVIRYERDRPGELCMSTPRSWVGSTWSASASSETASTQPPRRLAAPAHRRRRHTRLAYAEVLAGQDAAACAAFLDRAIRWYAEQDIHVERVMSDNAWAYRSRAWRIICARHRVRRRYTGHTRPAPTGRPKR